MNMFEEAQAMSGTLALCKMTQGELARSLGVSQSYVANKLRLLSFSSTVRARIIEYGITERHARCILRLEGEDEQLSMLERVRERELTVRECEALVDSLVDSRLPERVGKASVLERIGTFRRAVGDGINTLRSLGVDATARTSYYGTKTYITVCIDEKLD